MIGLCGIKDKGGNPHKGTSFLYRPSPRMRLPTCHMELQTVSHHNPKGVSESLRRTNGPTSALPYTKMYTSSSASIQTAALGNRSNLWPAGTAERSGSWLEHCSNDSYHLNVRCVFYTDRDFISCWMLWPFVKKLPCWKWESPGTWRWHNRKAPWMVQIKAEVLETSL